MVSEGLGRYMAALRATALVGKKQKFHIVVNTWCNRAELPVLVFLSRAAKPLYLVMLGDLSSGMVIFCNYSKKFLTA